ncbi:hypothetical protein DFJ77DRAFT_453057 [Powellomyces hirtus]|nr:hypothetical protein DFJ77DRAFT_453057 [Powellomyces hirtus]
MLIPCHFCTIRYPTAAKMKFLILLLAFLPLVLAQTTFVSYPVLNISSAHSLEVRNIVYYDGTLISTSYDSTVKQWNVSTAAQITSLTMPAQASGLQVSTNGSVWVGLKNGVMRRYNINSSTGVLSSTISQTYTGLTDEVNEIMVNETQANNKLYVASSEDYYFMFSTSVNQWTTKSAVTSGANVLRTTSDGPHVYSGGVEPVLRKWVAATGALAGSLTMGQRINGLAWVNYNLIVALHNGTVAVVNPTTMTLISSFEACNVNCRSLAVFWKDGTQYIFTGSVYGEIKQYTTDFALVGTYLGTPTGLTVLNMADDGKRIWAGDSAGGLRYWMKGPCATTVTSYAATQTVTVSKSTTVYAMAGGWGIPLDPLPTGL